LAAAEQDLQIQQETQKRLLQEQQNNAPLINWKPKPKPSKKLKTCHTKIILQSGLSGLCGLVAQLGRVEPRYQLAMETAAGGAWGW